MKKHKNDTEYLSIINPIMENNEFKKMNSMKHHNTTRMDHLLKVSYYSYIISKKLNLNYEEVARAGLLHDYYDGEISDLNNIKDKINLFTNHPNEAVKNAKRIIDLSKCEEDIIKSHMFPMSITIPRYKESWIVSIVDKGLSIKEFYQKIEKKIIYITNLYLILIMNTLK